MFGFVYIILILAVIGGIYWGHIQSMKQMGTPGLYIVQTYLYIVLSLLIVALTSQQIGQYHLDIDFRHVIISFLVGIGCIFMMHTMSEQSIYLEHIIWLVFVVAMAVMVFPIIQLTMPQIHQNVLIVVAIMVILSLIAFFDTQNHFSPILKYLIVVLFVLIVVEISHLLFNPVSYHTWSQFYDIIVILIFCFIVLADTQNLRENATKCGRSACIDYPSESTKIFLDILNLFVRVSSSRSKH